MMELHEKLSGIESKADLVEFVRALCENLRTNPEAWENVTLAQYLRALGSWIEDSDGYYLNQGRSIPTTPSWRDVADMLMAAKMYE
ncbi:MAG TPA: hypothetical protein VGI10_04295 [Polyangiaceae bacterium]|jgi:hypothetical protein